MWPEWPVQSVLAHVVTRDRQWVSEREDSKLESAGSCPISSPYDSSVHSPRWWVVIIIFHYIQICHENETYFNYVLNVVPPRNILQQALKHSNPTFATGRDRMCPLLTGDELLVLCCWSISALNIPCPHVDTLSLRPLIGVNYLEKHVLCNTLVSFLSLLLKFIFCALFLK